MQQQSAKIAALYYRVANKHTDGMFFDSQIYKLLCYATEREIDSFILYADIDRNGITSDRPALNALKIEGIVLRNLREEKSERMLCAFASILTKQSAN